MLIENNCRASHALRVDSLIAQADRIETEIAALEARIKLNGHVCCLLCGSRTH
ncbi:hypothetical protein GNX14_26720 [Mesorhizobium japonicum]|uniref:hypothetical protein n=1 Tax=Mesorhizobium TaxID=68287 RepID=UPI0012E1C947|nr:MULTISPECIES: hypothetical protein [Mesorhizobium]MUT24742.1 hypothetical protein [Mesorhizobium japonicum]